MQEDELSVSRVFSALGIDDAPDEWSRGWDDSASGFEPGGVFFLQLDFVRASCAWLGMRDESARIMEQGLGMFAGRPELERLAWHCHWLLFVSGYDSDPGKWPRMPDTLAENAGMFYALLFLSGLPHVRKLHAAKGIDEEITRDTLSDLELWMHEHHKRHGAWGVSEPGWLGNHFRGRLFKLGRLQYVPGRFHHPFQVYRNRDDRRVVMLAGDGEVFRADGQFADADNGAHADAPDNWIARLRVEGRRITGSAVDPRLGRVVREQVELDADKWAEILAPDDPVMTVHIPATGSMKPDACGESFRQAVSFYARYFPDLEYRAFTCASWLLDPQLEQALPEKSNIVKFLREWFLHPVRRAGDGQTLERVFGYGVTSIDPATAPRESSLQRAIVEHIERGGSWRSGGSVLFGEDLAWGKQVYR